MLQTKVDAQCDRLAMKNQLSSGIYTRFQRQGHSIQCASTASNG